MTPDNPMMNIIVSLDEKTEATIDRLNTQVEALLAELIQTRRLLATGTDNAQTWMPVTENETVWNGANRFRISGSALLFDFSELSEMEIKLPDGYALCRKVQP